MVNVQVDESDGVGMKNPQKRGKLIQEVVEVVNVVLPNEILILKTQKYGRK